PTVDHPLADFRLPGIQLDALVDAVQHLEQREIFEGNRVHGHLPAVGDEGGAGNRNRTYDLRITNAPLYQLSYSGLGRGFYRVAAGPTSCPVDSSTCTSRSINQLQPQFPG